MAMDLGMGPYPQRLKTPNILQGPKMLKKTFRGMPRGPINTLATAAISLSIGITPRPMRVIPVPAKKEGDMNPLRIVDHSGMVVVRDESEQK
jgi:hypothetical protein